MFKTLTPVITAALFAASSALFAQQSAPAPAPKAEKSERDRHRDCSKATDPKRCEERREKARSAMKKAHAACDGKKGDERRACMRKEMCAGASDPAKCEASAMERMGMRKKAYDECKAKGGDMRACMREQRGRDKTERK